MPVNEKELRLIDEGAALAAGGAPQRIYSLMTDDNATAVQANGYFDGALENGLNPGDVILASLNMAGTPSGRTYIVTTGGADVAVVQHGA